MKTLIYLILFVVLYQNAQSQTPQFETTFYFEDAVGNKDSVVVGYDPSVPGYTGGFLNGFSPQFVEKPKQEPFDTILDVRIDPDGYGWEPLFFYKRMIGFCEKWPLGTCYGGSTGAFIISNKYKPLKISYSQKAFGLTNNSGSLMTTSKGYDLIGPFIVKYYEYFCLSDTGEHIIDFGDSIYYKTGSQLLKENVPMKGDFLATLPQSNFYIGPGECLFHTATIEHYAPNLKIKVYPNPGEGDIHIGIIDDSNQLKESASIVISDILGRVIQRHEVKGNVDEIILPSGSLSPGCYIVSLIYKSQLVKSEKFVVMRFN